VLRRLNPPIHLQAGRAVEEPVQRRSVVAGAGAAGAGLGLGPSQEPRKGVLELLHLLHGELRQVLLLRPSRLVVAERANGEEAGLRPLIGAEMLL
jgi:hypothetical protein